MTPEPTFTLPLEGLRPRGIIPLEGKVCGLEGCQTPPTAAEPRRLRGQVGVSWYCQPHEPEAPAGAAFPIGPACGATAAADETPCGVETAYLLVGDVDGVDGLRFVSLCERHAMQMIDPRDA